MPPHDFLYINWLFLGTYILMNLAGNLMFLFLTYIVKNLHSATVGSRPVPRCLLVMARNVCCGRHIKALDFHSDEDYTMSFADEVDGSKNPKKLLPPTIGYTSELLRIVRELAQDKKAETKVMEGWRLVAVGLDRLFFLFYLVAFVGCHVLLIMHIPSGRFSLSWTSL